MFCGWLWSHSYFKWALFSFLSYWIMDFCYFSYVTNICVFNLTHGESQSALYLTSNGSTLIEDVCFMYTLFLFLFLFSFMNIHFRVQCLPLGRFAWSTLLLITVFFQCAWISCEMVSLGIPRYRGSQGEPRKDSALQK